MSWSLTPFAAHQLKAFLRIGDLFQFLGALCVRGDIAFDGLLIDYSVFGRPKYANMPWLWRPLPFFLHLQDMRPCLGTQGRRMVGYRKQKELLLLHMLQRNRKKIIAGGYRERTVACM